MIVPDDGFYLWDWYISLTSSVRRVREGVCEPIPPSEFLAWQTLTGEIVQPSEYAILRAMDAAFCAEVNQELIDYRERQTEAQKREIEAAKTKRGRK